MIQHYKTKMRPMEKLWAFPIQSLTNRFNSKTGNQT